MDEMGRHDIKKDNATVIRTDEGCWSVGTTFIYLQSHGLLPWLPTPGP